MTLKTTLAALAAICALGGGSADAAMIYGNLGPGGSHELFAGWTVSDAGSIIGETWTPGMVFISGLDAWVTEIDLAVATVLNGEMDVSLWTGDGTQQLGVWHIKNLPPIGLGDISVVTIGGISGIHLEAGSTYTLVAKAAPNAFGAWYYNDQGDYGPVKVNGVADYGTRAAFAVHGAVPEPAAWALMILGFGGAGAMLRRRTAQAAL